MTRDLERARAPAPKRPSRTARASGPAAAAAEPVTGVAAQLAEVHRTLRRGPALQRAAEGSANPETPSHARAPGANRTGLPDRLKAGIEALSGLSLDGVRVHRNSAEPARLGAHAYTQGTEIHVAPGQDAHLPHEAWHVVQQKQGRVKPTLQMKDVPINDDADLEREADAMGAQAAVHAGPIQRMIGFAIQLGSDKKKAAKAAAKAEASAAKAEKKAEDAKDWKLARASEKDAKKIHAATEKAITDKARKDFKINDRKAHIMNRHKFTADPKKDGFPNKTKFPKKWDEDKILAEVAKLCMDDTVKVLPGRHGVYKRGLQGGIEIEVYFYPPNPDNPDAPLKVSTAYPYDPDYGEDDDD